MKDGPPSSEQSSDVLPPPIRDVSGLKVGSCLFYHRMLPPPISDDGVVKMPEIVSRSDRLSYKSPLATAYVMDFQAQPKDVKPPAMGGGYDFKPRRK